MFEPDSSIPATGSPNGSPDASAVEKICQSLKSLITSKTSSGDSKGADKLQEVYDLLEEYKMGDKGEPDEETGSPEGSDQDKSGTGTMAAPPVTTGLGTSLTLGPMSKLKNYLAAKSVDTQNQKA